MGKLYIYTTLCVAPILDETSFCIPLGYPCTKFKGGEGRVKAYDEKFFFFVSFSLNNGIYYICPDSSPKTSTNLSFNSRNKSKSKKIHFEASSVHKNDLKM